ncbi:MAG: immunoglobulin domain-containing protein [Phycisphaerales bacterium]
MRMLRGIAAAALAGIVTTANAQNFTLHINADKTAAMSGETITWTVSVTGSFGAADYVQVYDLNFVASDNGLGTASTFASAMSALVNPTGGTVTGASISGASGGQSSILGAITAGPITLGSFTVVAGANAGTLSYGVSDGGIYANTSGINIKPGSDFAPSTFNSIPAVDSDAVLLGPALPAFTVVLTADQLSVHEGDTVTWTATVTGDFGANDYVQLYDLSFIANDPALGLASGFLDSLDPALGPTPGTPNGASLLGATGGQSSVLGAPLTGPIVLGSFTTYTMEAGSLTYTIHDGGQLPIDHLQIKPGSDGDPPTFEGAPNLVADTVTIEPLLVPKILGQPLSKTADAGGALLTLSVLGEFVDSYRWRFNGVPLTDGPRYFGTGTDTLVIVPSFATEGVYDVVLSNADGDTVSAPAVLVVLQPCAADVTGDGILSLDDINVFAMSFTGSCP